MRNITRSFGLAILILQCAACSSSAGSGPGLAADGTGGNAPADPAGGWKAGTPAKVSRVVAGGDTACAELDDDSIWCWGSNEDDQLGPGTIATSATTPVRLDVAGVTQVKLAKGRACATTPNGGVRCWGKIAGYNPEDGSLSTKSKTPVTIQVPAATAVIVGEEVACAIGAEGDTECWGENDRGQLGFGPGGTFPDPVPLSTQNMDPFGLASGAFRLNHGCGVNSGFYNFVVCWGDNPFGQLGSSVDSNSDPSPRVVHDFQTGDPLRASKVEVGWFHSCALLHDDSVSCWGDNEYGQLGNGTFDSSSSPRQVKGLPYDVVEIAAGASTTCALTARGTVSCWGENEHGILGKPFSDSSEPVDIDIPDGATSLALGDDFACAGYPNEVLCWGANDHGQLGDGTNTTRTDPTPVIGLPLP